VERASSRFETYNTRFLQSIRRELANPTTTLTTYQIQACLKVLDKFEQRGRSTFAIIVAPTGAGKSGMAAMLPYALGDVGDDAKDVLPMADRVRRDVTEILQAQDAQEPRFFHKAMILVRLKDDAKDLANELNSAGLSATWVVSDEATKSRKVSSQLTPSLYITRFLFIGDAGRNRQVFENGGP